MARDIEEFLRKAAERRQAQQGGGGKKPASQKPPSQQPPPRQQPKQRPQQPRPMVQEPIIIAEESPPPKRPAQRRQPSRGMRNESVAEHVQSHINTSDIGQSSSKLGKRIASVHDQVEARVHEHLDHDITVIDDTRSITEAPRKAIFGKPTTEAADGIRSLLQNPKTVAQAILVAEILKRPEF